METYSLASATKEIYDSGLELFALQILKDLLAVKKQSTLFSVIERLIKAGVLAKIERGKYLLKKTKINEFALANFLYHPSYISFETALNFYGVLSQFPYEVTSATPKKTLKKVVGGKPYVYIHLKKNLLWGYDKKDDFLIAFPEKALLDQLYLASKGLRNINFDELDFSLISKKRLKDFRQKFPLNRQFEAMVRLLENYLRL